MATGFEAALVKPIVDALVELYKMSKVTRLKSTAEAALAEAIRELLLAPSDLRSAETKIAIAKAAGIINADLVLAEEMVSKHKAAAKKPAAKKRPAAKKKAAAKKKPAAKK
ncbi:MAG: hypothetical protein ACOY9D_07850 [Pseudomonadota bacterium]